ncbi:MAG: hypothetical protein JNM17_08480 [Archangium sp.]|nr:hypothetical protein [Archangium sp.]
MTNARKLFVTRLVHTVIWAVMASGIVALPFLAWTDHFGWALAITVMMAGEGIALGCSRGACPLTAIARRYTDDPSPAFDIFLPEWLAKWNKVIFGALFVAGEIAVLTQVQGSLAIASSVALAVGVVATALSFAVRRRG